MCVASETISLEGVGFTTVRCGKCLQCLRTKRNEWSFRLHQESMVSNTSTFITLTYNETKLPLTQDYLPTLDKEDYTLFIKNLREENRKHEKVSVRYYGVGEYGKKYGRPHYHFIMFNLHRETLNKLDKIWKYGKTHIGNASPAAIRYITKYLINKGNTPNNVEKEFCTMSRRPAIGAHYTHSHIDYHRSNATLIVNWNGVKMPLPRYYKEKMFSKDELKLLNEDNIQAMDNQSLEDQLKYESLSENNNYYKLQQDSNVMEETIFREKFNKKNSL